LQSLTYGYYPTNNVQTITNAVASSQNAGSANMSYGYGTGSDLLATESVGGTVVQTIGYTADGRIASLNPGIQAPAGQYITSLSYNQDGRLTSVNAGGGALASYIYDGFEQRLIKTVSGSYGEIYQYGQDGALLEETNASGVAQADYIYLNGRPIAVLNGSTLYHLHDDMLGTPQLATDSSQNTQWQASYDAFGQASFSGTVTQNLRLPGQYFDLESGWNHNGFRDYLPALGRYAEPDPLGRLGSGNNLYAYANDNPANSIDPLGLCATRKLDPNSRECKDLAAKIAKIAADIQSSTQDLATNPLTLPYLPPYPGASRRLSVQGHEDLFEEKMQNLANRAQEYNDKCGGGDPFAGNASGAPSISPGTAGNVITFGVGAVIIGGTAILCPECLAVGLAATL
jgi:RHS repeat-associated protein